MGRPIDQYHLGPTGDAPATIPARGNIEGVEFEGYIQAQKGRDTFRIANDDNSKVGEALLTNKLSGFAEGEMAIVGMPDGVGADLKAIQKLTAHRAVDYDGVTYTWTLADDSTESVLNLTAI